MIDSENVRNPYAAPTADVDVVATTERDTEYDRSRRYLITCVLCAVGWALVAANRSSAAFLSFSLGRDFGLSSAQIGLITAAGTLVLIVLGIPAGLLADRVSRKPLLLIGLGTACGAAVLRFQAEGAAALTCASALDGLAEALVIPATITLIARLAPLPRSLMLVISLVGTVCLSLMFSVALESMARDSLSRTIAQALAALTFSVAVLLLLFGRDVARNVDNFATPRQGASFGRLSKSASAHTAIGSALLVGLATAVGTFGTAMLVRDLGGDAADVASDMKFWGMMLSPVSVIAGVLLTAWTSVNALHRVPSMLAGSGMVMILSIVWATTTGSAAEASFGFALLAAVAGFVQASMVTSIACVFTSRTRGFSTGIVFVLIRLAAVMGPTLIGVAANIFPIAGAGQNFRTAVQVASIVAVWAVVHFWLARRHIVEAGRAD